MRTTTAGAVKQGSRVLWFDSRTNALGPHRVVEVYHHDEGLFDVSLVLSSPTGVKKRWSGQRSAEIKLPKRGE